MSIADLIVCEDIDGGMISEDDDIENQFEFLIGMDSDNLSPEFKEQVAKEYHRLKNDKEGGKVRKKTKPKNQDYKKLKSHVTDVVTYRDLYGLPYQEGEEVRSVKKYLEEEPTGISGLLVDVEDEELSDLKEQGDILDSGNIVIFNPEDKESRKIITKYKKIVFMGADNDEDEESNEKILVSKGATFDYDEFVDLYTREIGELSSAILIEQPQPHFAVAVPYRT